MKQWFGKIHTSSEGFGQVTDITGDLEELINGWQAQSGVGVIFATGSTAGITTIEYAPGVLEDMVELMEALAPSKKRYHHERDWNDGNGFSHLRATLIGPSVAFAVEGGKLLRGRWQQFVLCDFDNRPRTRDIAVQLVGTPMDEG